MGRELPEGHYAWELSGLLKSLKKVIAVEGADTSSGEMRRFPVEPDPEFPDTARVVLPFSVPFVRVVCAKELQEELEQAISLVGTL